MRPLSLMEISYKAGNPGWVEKKNIHYNPGCKG